MEMKIKKFIRKYWIEIIFLIGVYLIFLNFDLPKGYERTHDNVVYFKETGINLLNLRGSTYSWVPYSATKSELIFWAYVSPLKYVLLGIGLILLFRKYAPSLMKKQRRGQKIIVLVDDDPFLLEIYQKKFAEAGYEVKVYPVLKGNFIDEIADFNPDIIMTNITMPEIDGFEFTKRLKSDERTENIKVVALTTCSSKEDRRKGLSLGMDDYLVKSKFTPDEVVGKISEIVNG